MFGLTKKEKPPVDPKVEVARALVPKKHTGYDASFKEVVKYIPGSSTIVAVLPAVGFIAGCWVLTDKAIHLWSPVSQTTIPLSTNVVASKGIRSLKVGSAHSEDSSITAHPTNIEHFYQALMTSL